MILSAHENNMIQINKSSILIVAYQKNNFSSTLVLFNFIYMEVESIYENQIIRSIYEIKPNYYLLNIEENNKNYLKQFKMLENEIILENDKVEIDSSINSISFLNNNSLAVSLNNGSILIFENK